MTSSSVEAIRITVINGPNLNRLGRRQPEIYGTVTLADVEQLLRETAETLSAEVGIPVELDTIQSNHEGELLDAVHRCADEGHAILINPGAFTHTSVALRDAMAEIADGAGFVEIHISNVHAREEFRRHSYLSDLALGVIAGLGIDSYTAGLRYLVERAARLQSAATEG